MKQATVAASTETDVQAAHSMPTTEHQKSRITFESVTEIQMQVLQTRIASRTKSTQHQHAEWKVLFHQELRLSTKFLATACQWLPEFYMSADLHERTMDVLGFGKELIGAIQATGEAFDPEDEHVLEIHDLATSLYLLAVEITEYKRNKDLSRHPDDL